MDTIIEVAIAVNIGFISGFLVSFFKIRNSMKNHIYASGVFKSIDEGRKDEFFKLALYSGFNIIILLLCLYEINH